MKLNQDQFEYKEHCPSCGSSAVLISNIQTEVPSNPYEADWRGSGNLLKILLRCKDCDYKWEICYGEHRDEVYVFKRNIRVDRQMVDWENEVDKLSKILGS